ncbi:hypothetical protein, partial [Bacillus thuringiensis]
MRKGIVLKLFLLTTVLCMLILATIFIGQTIFFKQYYADRKVNDIKANINSFERDYLNRVGNVEAMQKLEQDFSKKNNIWITTLDRYGNLKNANDFYVEVKLNDFSQNKLGKVTVTIPLYNLLKIDEIENEKLRSTPGTKVYLSGIEKDDIFIPASVSMADGNLNWTNKPLDKKMSETALEIKKGNIKDKGDLYTNFAGSIVKFQSPASIALGNPIYINDLFMERVVKQDDKSYEYALTAANSYFQTVISNTTSNWDKGELLFDRKLYNTQGEEVAYLFQVQQAERKQGYLIIGVVGGTYKVLESSREGEHPYQNVNKDESIYLGPLSYYKKISSSNEVQNITTKEINKIKPTGSSRLMVQKSDANLKAMNIPNYNYKKLDGVVNTTNKNGAITDTLANIVIYWSYKGYPNLNPNQENYDSIHDNLNRLIKNDSSIAVKGLKEYFSSIGKYPLAVNEYSSRGQNGISNAELFNKYKAEINANRPVWLNTTQHPFYGNTALTGTGYEEIYDPSTKQWHRVAVVHDTNSATTLRDIYVTWDSTFTDVKAIIPG